MAEHPPTSFAELPKTCEPQAFEEKWYAHWVANGFFNADPQSNKPAYSIVIPPPNVTGVLTLGHVLNNTIQDILARRARMLGKEVLWLPGTDHAGIATQTVVERTLKKQGVIRHRDDLGREKFLEKVWEWKEKHGGIIIQQLKKLGCSCDWSRERFTMDEHYSKCVSQVFVALYKKGLIYRGKRMVNWDPVALTALSDEEVNMKPQNGVMVYFQVEIAEQPGDFLTIATTRPETIPGDTAVAVNPRDERYAHLTGKHVVRPLPHGIAREQKLIPIIRDDAVDFEFGTGVLKVTPAHDKADFDIGQRHGLPAVEIMSPDGRMNALAGEMLVGLDRFEARVAAIERLRELGALVKEEPYQNNVGFSERTDVPVEPRLSEQWFLKYPNVEQARACVVSGSTGYQPVPSGDSPDGTGVTPHEDRSPESAGRALSIPVGGSPVLPGEKLRFFPPRWAKVYDHWMEGIQDWCISRQLWWGHRVPVWYRDSALRVLEKALPIIEQAWDEVTGTTARELRRSARATAKAKGLLNSSYPNLDTGWPIWVQRTSLEHAFSNRGVANIKLVPALPGLLRHAVWIASEPHEPRSPEIAAVHKFVAALRMGRALYRVKFTVKELSNRQKLYDHQTIELVKEVEPDGKNSPEAHPLAGALAHRPASGSELRVRELCLGVNADDEFQRCQIQSPGKGWTQDPDVLDTWFSAWLWPFATMGWPEKTDTLAKFYPTTDLITGPDIIFFWVARMIMAGFEFKGEMPFRNVYFTGIIRDKQGRKMSKSLGNSPDPLDLIAKFGADALRFGVMRSAPLGADILFDEKNVELGRNFCTKLWNAVRFRQIHGGTAEGEIDPALLTSDDRWILLRLDAAICEISQALDEYRFSDAAQALYRFFWSEFCDWYLEASKAALYGPEEARKANTLAVIDFVLGHTLRLMHPFLPFITEELWHGLGFHHDLPADQGGRTIMFASWPQPLGDDFQEQYGLTVDAFSAAEAKHDAVAAGRGLRRDFNIASNQRVRFVLQPLGTIPAHDAAVLKILLGAEPLDLDPSYIPVPGTPNAMTELGALYLPNEGLIDFEAERERLGKEIGKAADELAKVRAKLANPNFAEKAPAAVLEEHRQREASWMEKLAQLETRRAALG